MGTSHRHHATVAGEPNWGKTSSAVSYLGKAVGEGKELDNNPPLNLNPKAIKRKQHSIDKRIKDNYHKAVSRLIKAAGGRKAVASGKSRVIGHAGIVLAGSWLQAMAEIRENGLDSWLKRRGIDSLDGKSVHDIFEIITGFIDSEITSLDDTAAQAALQYTMGLIENRMEDYNVEQTLDDVVSGEDVYYYLDQFFGFYVYSHLSQDFSEKLEKEKGTEIKDLTMEEIRDLIIDDISRGVNGKNAIDFDWSSKEGNVFMQQEFDKIINALTKGELKDED